MGLWRCRYSGINTVVGALLLALADRRRESHFSRMCHMKQTGTLEKLMEPKGQGDSRREVRPVLPVALVVEEDECSSLDRWYRSVRKLCLLCQGVILFLPSSLLWPMRCGVKMNSVREEYNLRLQVIRIRRSVAPWVICSGRNRSRPVCFS